MRWGFFNPTAPRECSSEPGGSRARWGLPRHPHATSLRQSPRSMEPELCRTALPPPLCAGWSPAARGSPPSFVPAKGCGTKCSSQNVRSEVGQSKFPSCASARATTREPAAGIHRFSSTAAISSEPTQRPHSAESVQAGACFTARYGLGTRLLCQSPTLLRPWRRAPPAGATRRPARGLQCSRNLSPLPLSFPPPRRVEVPEATEPWPGELDQASRSASTAPGAAASGSLPARRRQHRVQALAALDSWRKR